MLLRGDIKRPENLLVVNADPGMENSQTYHYVRYMRDRCDEAGIVFKTVKRDLFTELLEAVRGDATRFDFPPFWTKNRTTGKRGRLLQGCTQVYKIAPMDRVVRDFLYEKFGISRKSRRLGTDTVCKWIGFSWDELTRIKEAKQKYIYFDYPLIKLRMTKADIKDYFSSIGKPLPPRSVCNACFANDVEYFKKMYHERPADWAQAVEVDEAIRDLSQFGMRDECYVSHTLIPLAELAERGFVVSDVEPELQCHSGYCFT